VKRVLLGGFAVIVAIAAGVAASQLRHSAARERHLRCKKISIAHNEGPDLNIVVDGLWNEERRLCIIEGGCLTFYGRSSPAGAQNPETGSCEVPEDELPPLPPSTLAYNQFCASFWACPVSWECVPYYPEAPLNAVSCSKDNAGENSCVWTKPVGIELHHCIHRCRQDSDCPFRSQYECITSWGSGGKVCIPRFGTRRRVLGSGAGASADAGTAYDYVAE
jgi:hypothetical protein